MSPCWCEIIVKVWSSTSSRVCLLLHCWNLWFFRIFQKMQLYWPTNAKQNANWSSKYIFCSNSVLSLSLAGCTFEEDSDPSLCEYRQAQEDDFDWQLVRTYSWPHMNSDLIRGEFFFCVCVCCNKHICLYYHSFPCLFVCEMAESIKLKKALHVSLIYTAIPECIVTHSVKI